MVLPEQGTHDSGRIGFCPHCNSSNIRIRRRRHAMQLWRCRSCNRTFSTPSVKEAWFVKSNVGSYVFARDIPRLERRARRGHRRVNNRRRTRSKAVIILAVVLVILAVAAGVWWGSANPDFLGPATEMAVEPTQLVVLPVTRKPEGTNSTPAVIPAVVSITSSPLTPTPTPDSTPSLTNAPGQTPVPTPTPAPVPTPIQAPTPIPPTPTPIPPPQLRHIEEKRYMLELINAERVKAGANPVVLGDNVATQLHAELALVNCFASHWGVDGLKPYMRYSLAGGYQSNGENGHGSDYCIKASDGYRAIAGIQQEIREAMAGWMGSPGHRRNILGPQHKKVNIGLAWDRYNVAFYQHFEGDYVEYNLLPAINDGVLAFAGETKNGAHLSVNRDLAVQISYDPPPGPLTLGQISRTYCYDSGAKVASLRWPLTGNQHWTENQFTTTYSPCPNPYEVAPDAPPASSLSEAIRLWREAYNRTKSKQQFTVIIPWITAQTYTVNSDTFAIRADISQVLDKHGDGVYSIMVWGKLNGEDVVISQYSIFHGVTPPDTYAPDQ